MRNLIFYPVYSSISKSVILFQYAMGLKLWMKNSFSYSPFKDSVAYMLYQCDSIIYSYVLRLHVSSFWLFNKMTSPKLSELYFFFRENIPAIFFSENICTARQWSFVELDLWYYPTSEINSIKLSSTIVKARTTLMDSESKWVHFKIGNQRNNIFLLFFFPTFKFHT